MVPIFNFSCRYVVCLYIVLFVYILFKLVEILDFDGLVFKCFFMLNILLNIVDCVLNDIDENCMKLNSCIWDNVWTDVCLYIKY